MAGISYNSTYDEIRKYNDELYASKRAQALKENDELYEQRSESVRSLYEDQIEESGREYDDLERSNAVQKLINEREIAESMANMGLTNSGLNRTQQTAVQLSAANNSSKIARERQSMVNSLTREMTSMLADIELNRSNDAQSINQTYDSMVDSATQEQYKTNQEYLASLAEIQAQAAAQAAAAQASAASTQAKSSYIIKTNGGLLSRNFTGWLSDNGVDTIYNESDRTVTYVDNNSGKKTTFSYGINPYTGNDNRTTAAYKKYGTYSNSYQPKGVIQNGTDYGKLKAFDKIEYGGMTRNVFQTTQNGTHYWFWVGDQNKYVEVKNVNGQWVTV